MKILLTGASGLVGSNVALVAKRRGHEVLGTAFSWDQEIPGLDQLHRLDLQDEHKTTALALTFFPDAIVNAAAISDPAACEKDPVLSRAINITLPETLAKVSHHLGARLIHLSSEQVFDGENPPYYPSDPVCPINLYGQQKVVSEQQVENLAPETSIRLRVPLLSGNSLTGQHSLHEKLFAQWSAGNKTPLFTDEFRQ
ncbi:MAG: sugar nucleotide-binding protein, partial [Opitutaceae bacterium]|nr:sugar nucleotide-binding protein [Opitutaceae bacterium]